MSNDVPTSAEWYNDGNLSHRPATLSLGAVLYCDGVPTSVTIRAMAPGGALLEGGGELPEVGALSQLVRGSLIVHGLVSASDERRCALQFSGSVDISQWQGAPINQQQQRVDDIVRLVKAGGAQVSDLATDAGDAATAGDELPQDLRRVADLLVQLGDELAADDSVILGHGTALQNLDIAAQVVLAVIERLAGGEGCATSGAKLDGLRRSADQALLRRD